MTASKSNYETDFTAQAKNNDVSELVVAPFGGPENEDDPERYQTREDLDKALKEAKQSEARLRKIIDTIPTLAWCALPDGSNEFLNQRWHDYTGLSPEEALGWGWKVVIHPHDLGGLLDKFQALLASGEPGESETRLRRFDGVYCWFLFRVEPLRDEAGHIVNWYGTTTDIEDRKRAESLLAAEQRTLEMISRSANLKDILHELCSAIDTQAPDAMSTILLTDPDGQRLWPTAGPRIPASWDTTRNSKFDWSSRRLVRCGRIFQEASNHR